MLTKPQLSEDRFGMRIRRVVVAASMIALAACATLTGCTQPVAPTELEIVGETLDVARDRLSLGGLVIYDLSTPVLDIPATYNGGQPDALWTVIVYCIGSYGNAIGVIPTSEVTSSTVNDAEAGEFDQLLVECSS